MNFRFVHAQLIEVVRDSKVVNTIEIKDGEIVINAKAEQIEMRAGKPPVDQVVVGKRKRA